MEEKGWEKLSNLFQMMAASENSELGFDTPQTERIEVKTIVKFYLFFS